MTVEKLQAIIKRFNEEYDISNEDVPQSDKIMQGVFDEFPDVDFRFWYPVYLASDWINDLTLWAEDVDEVSKEGLRRMEERVRSEVDSRSEVVFLGDKSQ